MSSPSTELASFREMGIYEPFREISSWGDAFRGGDNLNILSTTMPHMHNIEKQNKTEYVPAELSDPSRSDEEPNRPADKIQRRLAQNRKAARKSRLRKKAYVQQLESSRSKLAQLEQELERARQQGLYIVNGSNFSHSGSPGPTNSGITAFEMEYAHWADEQHRQVSELRTALQANVTDIELKILVESGLKHYNNLFRMKADAAEVDIFYLISGKYRTSVERFFLWIGGFRPSELIKILMPQLEPMSEDQYLLVSSLQQSSQEAEDALWQGVERLQQTLSQSMATGLTSGGSFRVQMADAIEKLEALEGFVNQADHVRQQTLQHMSNILTTRQAARGLLALGEYFHRLRALSSLWAARPRYPT